MTDPEIPARKKSKRKRWTVLSDPEEVITEIMNELQTSREDIDKKLSKYNDSFMQTQNEKRHQFIEYCSTRIRDLPKGVRANVATQLLSSEDFAVEMNFSEVHTSSANSSLIWSCSDASMSDTSWRTLLQQYAEDAAASATPREGRLARTTRSTRRGSSPAPLSNPIAEPSGHPTSMALSEPGTPRDIFAENDEDDEDLLSISEVTIPRPRKGRVQESHADPLRHEAPSTKEKQAPVETPPKTSRRVRRWSKQECATLRGLCHGKEEALHQVISPFWEDVSSQIPGRTQMACISKWRETRRAASTPHKKKTTGDSGARHYGARWSAEEVQKLAQCCSQPAEARDWAKFATQFPGRTAQACFMQYKKLRAANLKIPNGVQFQGRPIFGSEEVHGESEQGNMAAQEGQVDTNENPDGDDMAVL